MKSQKSFWTVFYRKKKSKNLSISSDHLTGPNLSDRIELLGTVGVLKNVPLIIDTQSEALIQWLKVMIGFTTLNKKNRPKK